MMFVVKHLCERVEVVSWGLDMLASELQKQ